VSSEILAREETERGELVLRRRDQPDGTPIYEIIFNGVFLMASTNAPSIATFSCISGAIVHTINENGGLRRTSSALPRSTVAISTP